MLLAGSCQGGREERRFGEERWSSGLPSSFPYTQLGTVRCLDCFPLVIKFQAPVQETVDLKEKID